MDKPKEIVKEASELGFAPGMWPMHITLDGVEYEWSQVHKDAEGDITCITYKAPDGVKLRVFND